MTDNSSAIVSKVPPTSRTFGTSAWHAGMTFPHTYTKEILDESITTECLFK